jgi:hypothetical protein
MSDEAKKDAERIWGSKGRIQKVLVDAGLAAKGRTGEVRPDEKDKGIIRLADSPDFDEIPRLRDMTILHEAGHLAHGEDLHKGKGRRIFLARPGPLRMGTGPKEQREELDKLREDPEYAERAYQAVRDDALEKARRDTGPQGVLLKVMDAFVDGPSQDEKLSKFVERKKPKASP